MSKVASHSFPWLQIHRLSKFALTCFPVRWLKCNTAVVEPVPCCSCGRHIQPSWHAGDFHQNCYTTYNHELLALVNQTWEFVRNKDFLVRHESILWHFQSWSDKISFMISLPVAWRFIKCPFDVVFFGHAAAVQWEKSANLLKFTSAEVTLVLWQKVVFQHNNLAR